MARSKKSIWIVIILGALLLAVFAAGSFKRTRAAYVVLDGQGRRRDRPGDGPGGGREDHPPFLQPGRPNRRGADRGRGARQGRSAAHAAGERRRRGTLAQRRTSLAVARLNLEKQASVDLRDQQQKVRQAKATAAYRLGLLQPADRASGPENHPPAPVRPGQKGQGAGRGGARIGRQSAAFARDDPQDPGRAPGDPGRK